MMPLLKENAKNLDENISSLVRKGLEVEIQQAMEVLQVIRKNPLQTTEFDLKEENETAKKFFNSLERILELPLAGSLSACLHPHQRRWRAPMQSDQKSLFPTGWRRAARRRAVNSTSQRGRCSVKSIFRQPGTATNGPNPDCIPARKKLTLSRPLRLVLEGDESIASDDVVMAMAMTSADEPRAFPIASPPHNNLQSPQRRPKITITPVRSGELQGNT